MHEPDDTARYRCHLADEAATLQLGAALAAGLSAGLTIYLEGDLGAGKTTLVRGLLRALGHTGRVKSPTYTLVEAYSVPGFEVYHFDLYRMQDPREWLDAGFRDVEDGRAVSLIEWPDKAAGWLPAPDVVIRLHIGDDSRDAHCDARTALGSRYLETCCTHC